MKTYNQGNTTNNYLEKLKNLYPSGVWEIPNSEYAIAKQGGGYGIIHKHTGNRKSDDFYYEKITPIIQDNKIPAVKKSGLKGYISTEDWKFYLTKNF